MHTYIHIYIHTYIHTHIHTYIHIRYMLANGWGVEVDVAQAVELFHRAVAVGEPAGWVGLGYVQYYGLGQVFFLCYGMRAA